MNIGIYGDSFAAIFHPCPLETHWVYKLGKKINTPIVNFARTASSTFYSYKKFLENYHMFDINIFLFTTPYRYTKPVVFENGYHPPDFFANYAHIENILKRNEQSDGSLTKRDLEFLENLKGWFIVSDDEYNEEMQFLMLKEIISKDKNVILYPSLPASVTNKIKKEIDRDFDTNAIAWANKAGDFYNVKLGDYTENLSTIGSHMTEEVNAAFAEAMYNYITTGKKIEIPDVIEHKKELSYYYIKKEKQ